MPDPANGVRFRELSRREIDDFLASHVVGRIAFASRDRVDIEPMHYAYEGGWLYGRTAPGAKLTTLTRNPWIAFEVDDVRGPYDWWSVVVHGTVYRLDGDGTELERLAYRRGIEAMRRVIPSAFTDDDLAAFRAVLFRVQAAEATGRAAATG